MKKRWLFTTLITLTMCVACFVLFPTEAKAASASDLTFKLNNDGISYTVSGCNASASGTLEIPATYNGLPVTSIGRYAFSGCYYLQSIIIPEGVIKIGSYAFYNMTPWDSNCDAALKNITIPKSVTSIGESAFRGCSGLTEITIPDGVKKINNETFLNCTSLEKINLSDNITSIGNGAFYSCVDLQFINLPKKLKKISDELFTDCRRLKTITIPSGVKSVGYRAFSGCTDLATVIIPKSVTQIGDRAFAVCDSLDHVFYAGKKADWNKISIGSIKADLISATRHYGTSEKNIKNTKLCTKTEYHCDVCDEFLYKTNTDSLHTYNTTTTKATLSKKGSVVVACKTCGYVKSQTTIHRPETFTLSETTFAYDGKAKKPTVKVEDADGNLLKKGTDYDVTYASSCKKPGTYTATVKMKGKYSGTKKLTYVINPIDVSKCKISLSKTSYTYDGKAKTPTVTVKDASGKKLEKGKDYTVTYGSGRINAGTYEVTVKMKGNYTGTKTLTFKIMLATPKTKVAAVSNGIKITWNKIAGAESYTVSRSEYSNGKWSTWKKIVTLDELSYIDKTVKKGVTYRYKIEANIGDDNSGIITF